MIKMAFGVRGNRKFICLQFWVLHILKIIFQPVLSIVLSISDLSRNRALYLYEKDGRVRHTTARGSEGTSKSYCSVQLSVPSVQLRFLGSAVLKRIERGRC